VHGPTELHGADVVAPDLRGGAALILAGIAAEGETVISNGYYIDRGHAAIDERLSALQTFTREVIRTAGAVSDDQLAAFLKHGYTAQNALEVVLGIGAYTMSTLANRMTRSPVDDQLAAYA